MAARSSYGTYGSNLMSPDPTVTTRESATRTESPSPAASEPVTMVSDMPEPTGRKETLAVAAKTQKLNQGIRDLRALGVEKLTIALPKICVVGDQSTGKSSLIEGISGIQVPRSADTCTRCPMEISLNGFDGDWSCVISLDLKYFHDVRSTKSKFGSKPGPKHSLGPWTERVGDPISFATVNNKADLGDAIFGAQQALLNPSQDPQKFKPRASRTIREMPPQVQFSPNIVRLDIKGPDLPNLTFFDLPGVISQHSENYFVRMISNLVLHYIEAPNCLIIQTLTMDNDAANSAAAALIKKAKATHRTMGVLTKPDKLTAENVKQYETILRNEKFPLGNGYFVVLNNVHEEVSAVDARRNEEHFFRTNKNFAVSLKGYAHLFGTSRLQERASTILFQSSLACLPALDGIFDAKARKVQSQLDELPKPPEGNLLLQVQRQIDTLGANVKLRMDVNADDSDFFYVWHERAQSFHVRLFHSYPRAGLRPERKSTPAGGMSDTPLMVLDSDDEAAPAEPTSAQPQKASSRSLDNKRRKTETHNGPDHVKAKQLAQLFGLEELKGLMKRKSSGVPSHKNRRVTETIFKNSTTHWSGQLDEFLVFTESKCRDLILQEQQMVFKQWDRTQLFDIASQIIKTFVVKCAGANRDFTKALLELESRNLMTVNKEAMLDAEEAALEDLQFKRLEHRCRQAYANYDNAPPATKKNMEASIKLTLDDFRMELSEMATARAYYQAAAGRFTEYVVVNGINKLFVELADGLAGALTAGLGINDPDANARCAAMLEIDPSIRDERRRLEHDLHTIAEGKGRMKELLRECGVDMGHYRAAESTVRTKEEGVDDTTMGGTSEDGPTRGAGSSMQELVDMQIRPRSIERREPSLEMSSGASPIVPSLERDVQGLYRW